THNCPHHVHPPASQQLVQRALRNGSSQHFVCCKRGDQMRRRELIIALGASALWPPAALGQQSTSRIVGVLHFGSLEASRTAFARAQHHLAEMGYVAGRNLVVEYRGADEHEDRLAALAGDLVQRRVDALVVYGGPPIVAAKAATTSIPI